MSQHAEQTTIKVNEVNSENKEAMIEGGQADRSFPANALKRGLQETSKEAGRTAVKLGWGSNSMRGKQEYASSPKKSDQIMHDTEQLYGRRP
jgi:hypothetical protein